MNVEMTEVTPLIDIQSNEEEIIPFIIPEVYDWNTSLLSLVTILNKQKKFISLVIIIFNRSVVKVIYIVYVYLSNIVDKC